MTTCIEVGGDPQRPRCELRGGLLVARRLPARDGAVRVALVASTAMLLAGDRVRVGVRVAAGHRLEVVETAGTVAYAMHGRSAEWDVSVRLGPGASLVWAGQPMVVADGADVRRTTVVDLDEGSVAVLREPLVLGRTGQRGGRLLTRTRACHAGRPLLVESLRLDPGTREDPAILGGARCVDTLSVLGARLPQLPGVLQLDGPGSLARSLVDQLHRSPLDPLLETARRTVGTDAPALTHG